MRLTGSTHPIFLDLTLDIINNLKTRGLLNPKGSRSQSFIAMLPLLSMVTEVGKSPEDEHCSEAFVLSRTSVAYPSSETYEHIRNELNHLILRNKGQPAHECKLCPKSALMKYTDATVHISGRCYDITCQNNVTSYTLGISNLTKTIQPIVALKPLTIETRCRVNFMTNEKETTRKELEEGQSATPNLHCVVKITDQNTQLLIGYSKATPVVRAVHDKTFYQVGQRPFLQPYTAHYEQTDEASDLQKNIKTILAEEDWNQSTLDINAHLLTFFLITITVFAISTIICTARYFLRKRKRTTSEAEPTLVSAKQRVKTKTKQD